ncbi:MAG: helix-turn-helix transcriptional regulator [Chloroflexi bacterium]|nr:helix-turn-helix transcriptional regulator [Chloroflexota bacterium]
MFDRTKVDVVLGERLRQARTEAGLTQKELAERMGWTQHLISLYESGSRRMHADLLPELARELEKPLSYFWENEDALVIAKGTKFHEINTLMLASREILNLVYNVCQLHLHAKHRGRTFPTSKR